MIVDELGVSAVVIGVDELIVDELGVSEFESGGMDWVICAVLILAFYL